VLCQIACSAETTIDESADETAALRTILNKTTANATAATVPTAYSAVVMPASPTSRVRRLVSNSQPETTNVILRRKDMGKGSLVSARNTGPNTDLWTADAPVDERRPIVAIT